MTGASRGIGAAVATLAGERGYAVAVNFATGEAEAAQVVERVVKGGGRAVAIQADVSQEQQIIGMFQKAEQKLGPIKALVNNAAVTGGFARVEDVSQAAIAKVLAVNVSGTMLCSREAVRRMSTRRGGTGVPSSTFLRARHTRERLGSGCTTQHRKARSTVSRSGWRGRWPWKEFE